MKNNAANANGALGIGLTFPQLKANFKGSAASSDAYHDLADHLQAI